MSINAARRAWLAAESFDELCALGARFVAGELRSFPGWMAVELDLESLPLARQLEAFNRAGFLTLASQPGYASEPATDDDAPARDGSARVQRAFVCGFASPAAALRIERLCLSSELYVALFRPGESGGHRTPVSMRAGEPYAFAGYGAIEEELACFRGECGAAALRALEDATYVSVIDLCWGRDTRLWTELERALCAPSGA